VLLVEALDRLTREDIDPAWELFRSILKSGVEVYTREPERHYGKADLNNFGTRIEVQAYFLRAYNESATKSMRGREYWTAARAKLADAKPKPIHKVPPAWLRLSADRQRFEEIPENVKAVRLIYRWAADGLGMDMIAKRLNAEAIPPIGKRDSWRRSYVAKLLNDRSAIGEYHPHRREEVPIAPTAPEGPTRLRRVPHGDAIAGYFPPIIPEPLFYRVRGIISSRKVEPGPKGLGVTNLFTGLAF